MKERRRNVKWHVSVDMEMWIRVELQNRTAAFHFSPSGGDSKLGKSPCLGISGPSELLEVVVSHNTQAAHLKSTRVTALGLGYYLLGIEQ